jgi:hypothetical protein
LEHFSGEVPLYILEDFYIGPASLKTSPPLGVFLVRKRVHALERIFKTEKKEERVGPSLISCGGYPFTILNIKSTQAINVPSVD